MKQYAVLIYILLGFSAFAGVAYITGEIYKSDNKQDFDIARYNAKIQEINDDSKSFFWEIWDNLDATKVYQYFLEGRFKHFPKEEKFREHHSFDSLWIHVQLPRFELTDNSTPLICIRPYKNKLPIFAEVETFFIKDKTPIKYAMTGRSVDRQDKKIGYHQNDYCIPLPQEIIDHRSSEMFFRIGTKRHFQESTFIYYSTKQIEETERLYRRAKEYPKHLFAMIFIGILINFILYTIIQFNQTKERSYLWYGLYLTSVAIYNMEHLDFDYHIDWIFSYIISWHYYYEVSVVTAIYLPYFMFLTAFLDLKNNAPKVYQIVYIFSIWILFMLVLDIFLWTFFGTNVAMTVHNIFKVSFVIALIYFFYAALTLREQTNDKKYITLYNYAIYGAISLIIGVMLTTILKLWDKTNLLSYLGIFEQRLNFTRLGIIIENLFFMSGLAYKARLDKEERSLLEARIKENKAEAMRAKIPAHTATNISKDIDDLFKNNELKAAKKYTSLFQHFLRNHYEQSFKKRIKLADELSSVESYIRLRSINPNRRINFIKAYNDIDTSYYQIPPGILIPVVENAINYAFPKHDTDGNEIKIQLMEDEDENLAIHIADNGIGINTSSTKTRTSTGLKSIEEICQQHDIALEIEQNTPKGTVISFHL